MPEAMTALTKLFHHPWIEVFKDVALVASIFLIGAVDVLSGSRIRLTAFFLVPVLLLTWRRGMLAGNLATLVALFFLLALQIFWRESIVVDAIFSIDMIGRFVAFFVNVAVLARLRQLYLQQKHIATRDPLTNLHNRLGWREIVGVSLEKARRESSPFGVIFLDCDNFKAINDKLGHGVGDKLLQVVARTLHGAVRSSDVTCRLGGDEFVAFFEHLGVEELALLVKKIKADLDAAMRAHGWDVTFSIGSVLFEAVPSGVDEVLRVADALMYEAKHAGKDRMCTSSWPFQAGTAGQ
jgi:diguanylate cyclase (GGDEF)-like protein